MSKKFFFAALCILILTCLAGCVYQNGGASVYEATALTDEGKELVKRLNIKYVCSDVYSLYFADILRSNGVFAIDVKETNDGHIQYKVIDQKYISQFKLVPVFSWWDIYGKFIFLIIFVIIAIFKIKDLIKELVFLL